MAHKRKAVDEKPARTGSTPQTGDATAKKRKIDWSTLDKVPQFKITAVNIRPPKKSSKSAKSKQKDGAKVGHDTYLGQHSPLDADVVQPNPFWGAQLNDLHVKITPAQYWESTQRYRRFTLNGEEFQIGQMVFVKKGEDEHVEENSGVIQHWLAKILEIRAGDPSHVFLRVFWAYRPEDLPEGRQPHHGASELIVSNHMDIIEAVTVESTADVVYWNDDPDSLRLRTDQLFFRQSYDITKEANSRLSKLNTYCIDKKPCNPDELLVQCPHCLEWLHAGCLKERALQDVEAGQKTTARQPKKQSQPSKTKAASTFSARIKGKGDKTRLTILEKQGERIKRKWNVDILCLVCGKLIDEARANPPKKSVPTTPAAQAGDDIVNDDKNNTTPTNMPGVDDTLIQDGEADSVIGDLDADEDVEINAAPASDTELEVPRRRGRPLGSKNKKRKRAWYGSTKKSVLPHAKYLKTETGKEAVSLDTTHTVATSAMVATTATTVLESAKEAPVTMEPESAQAMFEPTSTKSEPGEEVLETATHKTPAPAPISKSVLQSGVRSIKRLLWRA